MEAGLHNVSGNQFLASKYVEEAVDRQTQNNCSQDQGKDHLIGAEFFHLTPLYSISARPDQKPYGAPLRPARCTFLQ
jgi:hypothetical protein